MSADVVISGYVLRSSEKLSAGVSEQMNDNLNERRNVNEIANVKKKAEIRPSFRRRSSFVALYFLRGFEIFTVKLRFIFSSILSLPFFLSFSFPSKLSFCRPLYFFIVHTFQRKILSIASDSLMERKEMISKKERIVISDETSAIY